MFSSINAYRANVPAARAQQPSEAATATGVPPRSAVKPPASSQTVPRV